MRPFSRISFYLIIFFLVIGHLTAQNSNPKGDTSSQDDNNNNKDDLSFVFIPIVNTLLNGLSNLVPRRGSVISPSRNQINIFKKYYELSISAYCKSVFIDNHWSCKSCLDSVPDGVLISTFSDFGLDTNGLIVRSDNDKTVYLIFRGSTSLINIITDIVFSYDRYPGVDGAFVHQGFYGSYTKVKEKFKPILMRVIDEYPSYKVAITGHSFGGALAIYAAVDLHETDPSRFRSDNTVVYTFGSPRIGNDVFAKYVADTGIFISRTVHKNDIVPQSPRVSQGYLHVGVESLIYKDPDYIRICTSKLESSLCHIPLSPGSFLDHINYFGISSVCFD